MNKQAVWKFIELHKAEILGVIFWSVILLAGNIANHWLSALTSIMIGITCGFISVAAAAKINTHKRAFPHLHEDKQ